MTVEVALVFPVLLTLGLSILDVGHLIFVDAALQNAAQTAARFGSTGQAPGGDRRAAILQLFQDQTFGQVDPNRLTLDTRIYDRFSDINTPEPFIDVNGNGAYDSGEPYTDVNSNGRWDDTVGTAGVGTGLEIIVYEATYRPQSLTGFFDPFIRSLELSATVTVRNEGF